jgi:CRISPR-associated protein Csx17
MRLKLEGCTTQPLGSYLKSIAVLRLVAEQADPEARGWWVQGCFHLDSNLDEAALLQFFVETYRPTPLVAPWNGGSGFYPKDRKVGLQSILGDTTDRFSEFRQAIEFAQSLREVALAAGGIKESEKDEIRAAILRRCRNELPDTAVEWLDAAISISSTGDRAFAPILGTGGNEGRLDYTNNFMEYLAELLIDKEAALPVRALLRNALFADATNGLQPSAVGQFDPGRAGGCNQGQAVETKDFPSNPWNFVLTLEGAVAWAGGIYRKQGVSYASFLCSPFTVRPSPVGYGSAVEKEGKSALSRAEIWTPLWKHPASYRELRGLLREGRANIGKRPAKTGLEFAEAACALGVDRGISGFVRYNLLKRRGDSYVALPAGEFEATYRDAADLLRLMCDSLPDNLQLDESLRRRFDTAVYQALLRGGRDNLLPVAAAYGRIVQWLLLHGKRVPRNLDHQWVETLSEFCEARIAACLASMNLWEFAEASGQTITDRLVCVLEHRLMNDDIPSQLKGDRRAGLGDVARFLFREVDDELIEDLLYAFLTVSRIMSAPADAYDDLPPVYVLLRMPFLCADAPDGRQMLPDRAILSRLKAGQAGLAAELAKRKLRAHRYDVLDVPYGNAGIDPMRLAASLVIPVWLSNYVRKAVVHEENK